MIFCFSDVGDSGVPEPVAAASGVTQVSKFTATLCAWQTHVSNCVNANPNVVSVTFHLDFVFGVYKAFFSHTCV